MCNYSGSAFERGIVQGIVQTCQRYHISMDEAVQLVIEELDCDRIDAQEMIYQFFWQIKRKNID